MIMQRCCRPARKEEGTGKGHSRGGKRSLQLFLGGGANTRVMIDTLLCSLPPVQRTGRPMTSSEELPRHCQQATGSFKGKNDG